MGPTLLRRSVLLLLVASAMVLAVASTTAATPAPDASIAETVHDAPPSAAVHQILIGPPHPPPLDIHSIINAVHETRGDFVKSLADKTANLKLNNGRRVIDYYNVMVFNRQQQYSHSLKKEVMYREVKYHGIPYGVWVFESGWFRNDGDGGFINWAFRGSWTRSGRDNKHVTFRKRY